MAKSKLMRNVVLGTILVAVIGLAIWGTLYFQSVYNPVATPAPTRYELAYHDLLDSANDEDASDAVTSTWYLYDYDALDAEDEEETLNDLVFADFTLDDTGDTKTPDENTAYLVKIAGTDLCTQWWATDSRIFPGLLPILTLGVNDIYMMNETEDISLGGYSILGSVLANTDAYDWSFVTNCLDGAEGATVDVDDQQGILPYYDAENAQDYSIVFEFTFNETASLSWVDYDGSYTTRKSAAASVVYFEIDATVFGTQMFDFEFGPTLGSNPGEEDGACFELVSLIVSIGWTESNTNLDTFT